MTFEGQYLTYTEYLALGGSTIGQMPFNILEFEARKQIDQRTQLRLKNIDNEQIPSEVKMCDYHLIEKIRKITSRSIEIEGNKASETTDGYSVSYLTADQIEQIIQLNKHEFEDIMLNDLYGVVVDNTAILYNGVL